MNQTVIWRQNAAAPVKEMEDKICGWDFWTSVYEDKTLRQEIQESAQQSETRLSDLLKNPELCQAELIFQGVPRLAANNTAAVVGLIKSRVGQVSVFDVNISYKQWVVRFYRADDALRVMNVMNGVHFRGKLLTVSFAVTKPPQPTPVAATPPLVPKQSPNANWGTFEWNEIHSFKENLYTWCAAREEGLALDVILTELATDRLGAVRAILDMWPLGLLRSFAPNIRMTGRYLSLCTQNNLPVLIRKAAAEGSSRVPVESWEPMCPADLRTEHQMLDYLASLLTHFGPQHVYIDLPIRLLCTSLGSQWSQTAAELAQHAQSLSPQFVFVENVLYLTNMVRHRRLMLDAIEGQPISGRMGGQEE